LRRRRRRRSGQRRKSRGGRGEEPSGGRPRGHWGGVRASARKRWGLSARVREGGTSFYMDVTLSQLGQLGQWVVVPAHGLRRARRFRVVLGWHSGLRLQPRTSPTSCSCRPKPNNIVLGSCSCRAKMSCFGLVHGPRAIWPSIQLGLGHVL
jgi:hypothetical protein